MAANTEKSADMYMNRVVAINRTTKVREGGRDFNFSAIVVSGDGNGRIGYGRGKAKEVVEAVRKATENARRGMVKIDLNNETIQHSIVSSRGATKIVIIPGASGTGIIAGGAMRPVFEVAGVKNVIAKCIGSSSPANVVRTTIESLINMSSPAQIAEKRGKTIKEIFGKKKNVEE